MSMTADIYYKMINRLRRAADQVPGSSSTWVGAGDVNSKAALYGKVSVNGMHRSMEDTRRFRMIAAACSLQMHEFVRKELMCVVNTPASGEEKEEQWRAAMRAAFLRMDHAAVEICICGRTITECGGCRHFEVVHAGSTALVAVLTPDQIVVSKCGNSRTVLCRDGRAISLSRDHKPDREDELSRIVSAGGCVIDTDGPCVEGILPMSTAIGDKYFKHIVTPEPETIVTDRNQEDECLILASDGLWNEISIELSCQVASTCLREGGNSGMDLNSASKTERPSEADNQVPEYPCSLGAKLLTRLAIGCNSSDDISVVVIDLRKK